MFASSSGSLAKRRGIVLVVVLGMLGLMALIGVTFATFAGQSLIGSRNFIQGVARPQAEVLMDYALAQLINDTNNPVSAIRGHSLLRDMYGNDSVFRGSNPTANPASETGGVITSVYDQGSGTYVAPKMTYLGLRPTSPTSPSPTPFYNQIQFQTNIPTTGQYYGLDFTRWIVKIQGSPGNGGASTPKNIPTLAFASQTFEILEDDSTSAAFHKFTFSNNLINPMPDPRTPNPTTPPTVVPGDWASFLYLDPNYISPNTQDGWGAVITDSTTTPVTYGFYKGFSSLAEEWISGITFTLDGRNMRAFNGPGLTQYVANIGNTAVPYPYNLAALANFRVTGFNPDAQGMDEDYDACDLENWFLALQSADGQVMIPSFHRPGILMASDWTASATIAQVSKILRPRQIDNSPLFPPDPSTPDPITGKLSYDIDNDGDGVTDSVWVDLGYSIQRDPGGKQYKPLFAFMVLGLNGRLPLNTVGNLAARANADHTNNMNASSPGNPVGTPLPIYSQSTGQVPYPGIYGDSSNQYYKGAQNNAFFGPTVVSSQTYYDAPLFDHASHLGYSVNEINPKFALQNAPSNVYSSTTSAAGPGIGINVNGNNYSQVDNAGVSVALTQMRNILAGTIPTDLPYPYTGNYPLTALNTSTKNSDANVVMVNGQYMILPNNMADLNDINAVGTTPFAVARNLAAVPGRWGEPSGILQNSVLYPAGLGLPGSFSAAFAGLSYPGLIYNNPVRAGKSIYVQGSNDIMDDDFDGTDPMLTSTHPNLTPYISALYYYREPTAMNGATMNPNLVQVPARTLPEYIDNFDSIGQRSVPAERFRHYVIPHDPSGVGRVVDFMNRPNNDNDFGRGYDSRGRASYFRYYRAAGMPQDIRYPYYGPNATYKYPYSPTSGVSAYALGSQQRYLMPQLFPAGNVYSAYSNQTYSSSYPATGASDIHNNRYHGFQSMLSPEIVTGSGAVTQQMIASMGAMPYDWDNAFYPASNGNPPMGDVPAGYPSVTGTLVPVSRPTGSPSGLPATPPLSGPGLTGNTFVNNFAPTIDPYLPQSYSPQNYNANLLTTSVNSSSGPNFGVLGNPLYSPATTPPVPIPIGYGGYQAPTDTQPYLAPVVNGYLNGGLNKDEADEMNLYAPNRYDMPYGPSDLEWLYRLQDVDGATLTSRLSQLAPVSFLNPADGLTRRRLFSTDSWEPTGWVYANDNPSPYAGVAYSASTDHTFAYNSRFTPTASPSLENMNQIDGFVNFPNGYSGIPTYTGNMANPITTEYLPNPTFPTLGSQGNSYEQVIPNSGGTTPFVLPTVLDTAPNKVLFDNSVIPRVSTSAGVVVNFGNNSMVQAQTPPLAHRDRRINLNYPLPISNDPAEPVRQKWCRETYTLLKAILPPSSVDTPEELAALSQFVVNIIDFRDPDCTTTRFVNTDLVVTDVLTRSASTVMPASIPTTLPAGSFGYDTTWNVSPSGVRFANSTDATFLTSFPYDPALYNPDVASHFLVQHGMEYNPIAINEGMAFQYQYVRNPGASGVKDTAQGLILELTNTLTEEQNNNGSNNNASAINLAGWDLVVAPDNFGWGRPDSITGEVNPIALPPILPPDVNATPVRNNWSFSPFRTAPTLNGVTNPFLDVKQYQFTTGGTTLKAISGTGATATLAGLYLYHSATSGALTATNTAPANAEASPGIIPMGQSISFQLPAYMLPTAPPLGSGSGLYYWVYLRRPANPFDTANLGTDNPAVPPAGPVYNREMVVVDAIRVPYIDGGGGTAWTYTPPATGATGNAANGTVTSPNTGTFSEMYSTRRLQPYRGGHLLRTSSTAGPLPPGTAFGATTVTTVAENGTPTVTNSLANGVTTICPPSPCNAYGYSEQAAPATGTNGNAQFSSTSTALSGKFRETIGNLGGAPIDTTWAHFPFNDRDFSSVAELLQVPGCPPGLFTKQFIEEPYPGNVVAQQVITTITLPSTTNNTISATTQVQYGAGILPTPPSLLYATGSDNSDLAATTTLGIKAPVVYSSNAVVTQTPTTGAPTSYTITSLSSPVGGRKDFENVSVSYPTMTPVLKITPTPTAPTFPYLPDNFYYTAASVAPPAANYPAYYTHLTTEIGGWTGAGWHKMMEFFEVPSSAIGAIGTADGGYNFDWSRQDIKPGLLNLNLIIDEEVFAGLFDDPRLNERLATLSGSGLPQIVTQIDTNGYPTYTYLISNLTSVNQLNSPLDGTYYINGNNNPVVQQGAVGRGYVARDADSQNFAQIAVGLSFPYQQIHGLKAAFSDFLKLRHGGSGFLFAHGAGPTGAGSPGSLSQPIAADRPYRSLSYPDINYTIMRPASLPPSLADPAARYTSTTPALPAGLTNLFSYNTYQPTLPNGNTNTYVQLYNPVAPMNLTANSMPYTGPFQYAADPGVKNPYLGAQYTVNAGPPAVNDPDSAPTNGNPVGSGPPYAQYYPSPLPSLLFTQAAPFPPPIPPTPGRRLIQVPDLDTSLAQGTYTDSMSNIYLFGAPAYPSSNASLASSQDGTTTTYGTDFAVNQPVLSPSLFSFAPTLVPASRAVFSPDNNTPNASTSYTPVPIPGGAGAIPAAASNFLGAGRAPNGTALPQTNDYRQHPLYQSEWLQKIMNLTTVRTHQFAVWITVGFFEVAKVGTPELGIPDVLGQELGLTAGKNIRYRSFFTLDRTKATGFNPYYPGNFRDCVTYRRRIE